MNVTRISIDTDDFDAFSEWERSIGGDCRRQQLSRGTGRYRAEIKQLGPVTIWRYRPSQQLYTEFAIPAGMVDFCFSRYPAGQVWCGIELGGTAAAIHLGGKSYQAVTPPGGTLYAVMLPQSLAIASELMTEELLSQSRTPERVVYSGAAGFNGRLLDQVDALLDSDTTFMSLTEFSAAQESLLGSCRAIVESRLCPSASYELKPLVQQSVVTRARDFIEQDLEEELTTGSIAKQLGVSKRALELSFRRILDVAPYQYVLVNRLHQVRRILKEENVTALAASTRCGFKDPSRFAGMYKRHFGELPSQTKRRR